MQRKILGFSAISLLSSAMFALASGCGGKADGDGETGGAGGGGGNAGTISVGDSGMAGASDETGGTTSNSGGTTSNSGGTTSNSGGTGTSGTDGIGLAGAGAVTDLCGDAGCVCANGLDDDDDGLVDGLDPECIGPTDNDEGSFATGIPGDNRDPKWQDCFFDGNSGAGDDGCRYASECLTGEYEADDPSCTVTQGCLDFCIDRTPSGCDCFGCCTVGLDDGGSVDVMTLSTCSIDNIEDETACPRCTKSTQCENECGECELCLGKTEADLPESCGSDTPPPDDGGTPPPTYTCDDGTQVCGPDSPCPGDQYCRLGCCTELFVR
jgi:hypothetical protein